MSKIDPVLRAATAGMVAAALGLAALRPEARP